MKTRPSRGPGSAASGRLGAQILAATLVSRFAKDYRATSRVTRWIPGGLRGFTLLEIIATLVLVGILGAALASFYQSGVEKSATPANRLATVNNVHKVMENIVAEFNGYPRWVKNTAYTSSSPQATVTPTVRNGHFYKCTTAGTTSGSEPVWPTSYSNGTTNYTVSDGTAVWTECTIEILAAISTKVGVVGGSVGSTYLTGVTETINVVENKFVKYNTSRTAVDVATGDLHNILKISLNSPEGQALTTMFGTD